MDKSQHRKERFKRLAMARTNAVLRRLRVLGNCSNRSTYDYTEEEINKIFSTVERKAKEVKARFTYSKHKEFKF